jgi:hypothetical protein
MEGAENYRSYLHSSFWYFEIDRSSLCVLQASEFLRGEGGGQMQQTFLPTGRQSSKPITTTDCSHVACYTTLSTDYMHVLPQYLDNSRLPRTTEYLTIPALFVYVYCIGDSSQESVPQIVTKPLLQCFTFSRSFQTLILVSKEKYFPLLASFSVRIYTDMAQYKRTQKEHG